MCNPSSGIVHRDVWRIALLPVVRFSTGESKQNGVDERGRRAVEKDAGKPIHPLPTTARCRHPSVARRGAARRQRNDGSAAIQRKARSLLSPPRARATACAAVACTRRHEPTTLDARVWLPVRAMSVSMSRHARLHVRVRVWTVEASDEPPRLVIAY